MARGDHIRVARMRGLYYHHGIDMGDGTVVHFSGEPLRLAEALVTRDTMAVFSGGYPVEVVDHGDSTTAREEAADTALAHLGETGYRLWRNNCEHFASYCKTGRKRSPQVRRAVRLMAASAAAAFTAGVTIAAARQRMRSAREEG